MNQELWDALFSWITGTRCWAPEGCSAPLEGIIVYLGLFALLILAIYLERDQLVGTLWRR